MQDAKQGKRMVISKNEKDKLWLLGQRVKTCRDFRNLNQEQLAELANISLVYISNIEKGKVNPSFIVLFRLSSALKVDLHQFINFSDMTIFEETD